MKMKRVLSLFLAVLLGVSVLTGCSSDNSDSSTTESSGTASSSSDEYDYSAYLTDDGRTIMRVAMSADPGTYDPAEFGGIDGLNATAILMRESLYERDEDGNLINQIAKDYMVEDDNLTYHVEIYDYVYDSAGNHLTADDVVFCFNRAKEMGFNSTSLYDSVEKEDDYNVTINLNSTSMGVFAQVTQIVSLYTQKAYEDANGEFGSNPVFTGAYELTDWTVGSSLTFEKRDDYWQEDDLRNIYASANVDVLEFQIIKEAAQLSIALETDEIDMVYNMSVLEAQNFMEGGSSSDGYSVFEFMIRQSQLMYLNVAEGNILADNLELREAVMYAIDIDGMIDGVVDGYGEACKTFGNSTIGDYQTEWDSEEYFDYDVDYAKECLANAGYSSGEVTLRVMTTNDEVRSGIALMLQAYLLEVGINVEILTYEDALFNTYKYDETQFDILLEQTSWNGETVTTWRDKFDQNYFENGKNGFTFAEDDELQSLLDDALDITTYSAEGVNAFHQYLKNQAYARGLFNQISYSVTKDCVVEYMNYRAGAIYPAGCTYVWNED
ncbi:MAG: ABC transporter substrate-binding protein [Lachnospiraceae bacterium]